MNIKLSDRVQRAKPSVTLAVSARAAELRAAGRDVLGLGAGEPDFDTPEHIKEAAIRAIHDGKTKYTAVDGILELRQAITRKLQKDNGLVYAPEQIIVSCGAKHSLYNLCQALLGPGDEVVIPAPYWVSYPDMAMLADATPVIVSAGPEQGFKLLPGQLREALNERTRLFIINSPSNPTGAAYTHEELAALGAVLADFPDVVIATDEIYEHIYWGEAPFVSFAEACPQLAERTVVVNGVSKAYAMTGWRIGYAASPVALVRAMRKIQGQSTTNPSSISQYAAVAALDGDQACVARMNEEFRARHEFVVAGLNAIDGLECQPAAGAFYAFPDCRQVIDRLPGIDDDLQFSDWLLAKAGVAVVPGSGFGAPGHIRISFATSRAVLEDALGRIAAALDAALVT